MKKIIRLTESDLARIVRRVIKEQASTPNEILLNYDSTFRNSRIMDMYDMNAKFVPNGSGGMTLKEILFVPGDNPPKGAVSTAIPLVKPFTFTVPLDYNDGDGGSFMGKANINLTQEQSIKLFGDGVKTAQDWNRIINTELSLDLFDALAYYANQKGMYTGPDHIVATQFAIFTNMPGKPGSIPFS